MHTASIEKVPTNIITGFLGAGKSTVIRHLLKHKPEDERWAILVNEFGAVGIDGGFLRSGAAPGSAAFIREVPGGCMCCANGLPMQIAITELLRAARPHRLLIEPTGLGHPKELLEVFTQAHFQQALALQRTITLVDARNIASPRHTQHPTFRNQLEVADVIVASKADCYEADTLACLEAFVSAMGLAVPITSISNGELATAWLQGASEHPWHSMPSDATQAAHRHQSGPSAAPVQRPIQHFSNAGEGYYSRGWIFAAHLLFDRSKLRAFFAQLSLLRAKGVFITEQGIIAFNKAEDQAFESSVDEHGDSRVEFIASSSDELTLLEPALMNCLMTTAHAFKEQP